MGQGNSANPKLPVQKTESAEQEEPVESKEDDDTSSKLGSLKKGKWLPRKQSEDKPKEKKPKKSDKKKKKKDEQEEVSSATCISDSDRTSLRHSRLELHLEECQPAPDEDDAISLSSCGEDTRKNLKDIENEEPPTLLICDYSSSNNTASPGESLSSGQDSGFARGNTIRSVSSEEEHAETNQKSKEITSEISTELNTPTVEVTEKCKDYIEKLIVEDETKIPDDNLAETTDNVIAPSAVPVPVLEKQSNVTETPDIVPKTDEVVDDQTKPANDSPAESTPDTINMISVEAIPSPMLETQTSLTEIPELAPKIEEICITEDETKNADESAADSNLLQENTVSTTTVSSPKLETQTSLTETEKIETQTEVLKESDLVTGMVKELVNETLESAVEYLTHEYKKMNNNNAEFKEVIQEIKVEEETVDQEVNLTEVSESTEVIEVTSTTGLGEKSGEINETQDLLSDLPPPPFLDQVSGEVIDIVDTAESISTEKTEAGAVTKEEIIVEEREVFDSLNKELAVEVISAETVPATDSVDVTNVEIADKTGEFEDLSYSLEVKSGKDANGNEVGINKNEIEALQNCDSVTADDSLLSTESAICEELESLQVNDKSFSHPDVLEVAIQNEEITTDLDADDSGINNSSESLPPFPSDINDVSVTENKEEIPSFPQSTPEIIAINEVQHNGTDSSSGSTPSPSPTKESKGKDEQTSSSTTQQIPDSTTGAVFV